MASQGEHSATSVASAEALAFWQWLEVVAQDASALQEWQALTAQERESWLLERGFQLEELELGLAALSRSAVIRPAEAQAARAWLDQGLLPAEQQLKTLLSLAVTSTTDLAGRGGGGSYPVEHPVRRWRADRQRWTAELTEKEQQLYEKKRNALIDAGETVARGWWQNAEAPEQSAVSEKGITKTELVGKKETLQQEAQAWERVLRQKETITEKAQNFYTDKVLWRREWYVGGQETVLQDEIQGFKNEKIDRYKAYKAWKQELQDLEVSADMLINQHHTTARIIANEDRAISSKQDRQDWFHKHLYVWRDSNDTWYQLKSIHARWFDNNADFVQWGYEADYRPENEWGEPSSLNITIDINWFTHGTKKGLQIDYSVESPTKTSPFKGADNSLSINYLGPSGFPSFQGFVGSLATWKKQVELLPRHVQTIKRIRSTRATIEAHTASAEQSIQRTKNQLERQHRAYTKLEAAEHREQQAKALSQTAKAVDQRLRQINEVIMARFTTNDIWSDDLYLLNLATTVHDQAKNGGLIAGKLQDRLEAGKIGQGVKRNVGNPVLLIPAVMAANKQRLKLKSTIQTRKSTYEAAVAAVPLNKHGEQKHETDGQLELLSIHNYWDDGAAKDNYIYKTPKTWYNSYQGFNINQQFEWSDWVCQSEEMFYNSERNALATGKEEYTILINTGQYTKRQARNIATASYFDALIKEDINWAESVVNELFVYKGSVALAWLFAFAPGVLKRQIRVAKWVVYTDRHPFLWQSKLKFKINRENYLNREINKWYNNELNDKSNDGFIKHWWHFTEHNTDVFLKTIESTTGHILRWWLTPEVWGLNEVSKLWGGDLGTHLLSIDSKAWHVSWYIFDHILKNTVLLPYRLGRSLKHLDGQFWHWLKKGAHPKGFWDGLKKDTRSLRHLVENIEFAILSLETWGHAKYLMPHTAHRLHQEWRSIKFAANHPKIFRKQEQDLLRLETKSVIRIDVVALKTWKTVARNTNLIESPAHYFASQEWRWIMKNKPKQAAIIEHDIPIIGQDISTAKSMAKWVAEYEKMEFASESPKAKVKQLRWLITASSTGKKEALMKYLATPISQLSTYRPINITQWVTSKKQELYAIWGTEKADVKGMMRSAQEESKSLVSMNLRFDIDLVTALHKSSQQQRRALGNTWAVIMALPTITSNVKADKKEDKGQYTKWQKKFQNATSYDWSGMGGNEGLSITQSLVNAFIFSITSSATEKKLRNWTKNRGKGDGLQAFRLIILAYMAPNIQTINGYINNDIKSGIKQQYSLAQQKYDQLNRLDRMLITREFEKSPKLRSALQKDYRYLQKDYRQLKKLDRKFDMIQRLGRVKITDARLKNAKQKWQDETLLVPVTVLVQHSKRWSSLTANQQATYSTKYTKWLTTNQDKKTRTLKKDVDRTKGTSSNLHTQQQAWSSDQAAIASGETMTVGQIVVSMKPIGNPDAKNPTSWESVNTPDIRSIQAGLERQFGNLAITSGTTPPAPTSAPAPNPEIKPVQLLTLYFQIKHFDQVYRRINRAIDKYWYGLDDAEIKGLSDAEVKKLRELGWSDEKVDHVRNILKTDSSPWQDFKKLKSQIDLEADLNEFSELERQQLEDLLLARDGKKMRVIRDSLRLENEVAQKGIDDTVSSVERDLEQAVEDRFSGDIDNVVIDMEGNAAGEIEAVADGAAVEEETLIKAEIEAEEVAADEALETTIEAAEIAAM